MTNNNPKPSGEKNGATTGVVVNFTFLLLYLCGLSAFGSFVNDMFTPALPSMTKYFGCAVSVAQLGLTMGMIGLATGQIIFGPASYKYGRKPILVVAICIFLVGATVSLFSPNIHFFNVCRMFQGIGASAGYFLARTVPADVYGGSQLAKFMAVMGGINGLAPACAPVLGGLISDRWGWKGIFIVLVVIGVILLCISPKMKETLPPADRSKGSVWSNFRNYLTLLRNKSFMIHTLFKGSALGLLFAYISGAPFIYQTNYGWSQVDYGFFIGVNAIFVALGSMTALKFHPLKKAAFVGSISLFVSVVVECVLLWFVDNFWVLELFVLPMLYSLGMIFTVTNTLAMNEGRRFAGAASALLGVVGYVFGAVAAPLVGFGNILHSTALVYLSLGLITLVFSCMARRIAPDLLTEDGGK